jgi:hypothetical protein
MLTPLTQVVQDIDYLRPRAAPSITGDALVRGYVGWGTTFLGPSAAFSTDPSGVIGGTALYSMTIINCRLVGYGYVSRFCFTT